MRLTNKEQFIDKYHNEIHSLVGTLDIELLTCVYESFTKTIDILATSITDKPTFVQIVDFEDKLVILNNTLFYILPRDIKGVYFRHKHKLYSKYQVPIAELLSFIYDVDYYYEDKEIISRITQEAKDVLDKSDIKGLNKYGRLLDSNSEDNFISHAIDECGDMLKYLVKFRSHFKQLCKKYPNDQELGEEFRRIYGGV